MNDECLKKVLIKAINSIETSIEWCNEILDRILRIIFKTNKKKLLIESKVEEKDYEE